MAKLSKVQRHKRTAAILGERGDLPSTLEVTGLSLQQLFVQLVGTEHPSDPSHR